MTDQTRTPDSFRNVHRLSMPILLERIDCPRGLSGLGDHLVMRVTHLVEVLDRPSGCWTPSVKGDIFEKGRPDGESEPIDSQDVESLIARGVLVGPFIPTILGKREKLYAVGNRQGPGKMIALFGVSEGDAVIRAAKLLLGERINSSHLTITKHSVIYRDFLAAWGAIIDYLDSAAPNEPNS